MAGSAGHGDGLGARERDMLAALGLKPVLKPRGKGARADEETPPPADVDRPIRVAIVGRPNAGKSTLVNALVGEERMITGPEPGLTRDAVATDFTWKGRTLRLFDTAGLRRKARIYAGPDFMKIRTRKFIGTIGLLVLVVVWSLLGMTIAQTPWLAASRMAQGIFYVVAGLGWVLPAMPLIAWMARPDAPTA